MIQEEIARLTGTLKFNVDAKPLVAFEKKLAGVTAQIQKFGQVANKKFTIKVSLDSKALREQLEKAGAAKIAFKNFSVNQEALAAAAKRISTRLNAIPISLTHIKVDVAALIGQKNLIKTLLGQMSVQLPVTLRMKQAETQLRAWKTNTETKFTLRLNADISQARFIANVRKSLRAAASKIGALTIKIHDPKLRLTVDQANLRAQIKAAISAAEFDVRVRVRRGPGGDLGPTPRGGVGALGGGLAGAGMGFMRGAIPGLGAAFAFSQLNKIQQQMQGQGLAMTAVMGDEAKGKEQSQWVKSLSQEIGMDYRAVAPSYNKMLASGQTSGMSTKSVQNIFQGVSEYGRVMGLDSDTMKGSMRAIEQMMNKGQVMSEELKGQLAERMPGAMSAMAEAAGFGSDKASVGKLMDAMKKGTVKSTDVLEKFGNILAVRARSGGALEKAKTSTAAEQARMSNGFTDAVMKFSEGGFDKGMAGFFRSMAEGMEKALPGIENLGHAFEILIEPVDAFINVGATILKMLPDMGRMFGLTGGQLAALGVTAGLVMLPFGGVAAAIAAIVLAVDDLITYSEGGDSLFGDWLKETPDAQMAVDKLGGAFDNLKLAITGIDEKVGTLHTKIGMLSFSQSFMSSLDKLASILNALGNGIDAASKLMSGDAKGVGESLSRMGNDIQDYMKQSFFDVASSVLAGQAETMIAQRTPAEQAEAFMRETTMAPSLVIGDIQVQVVAPDGSDGTMIGTLIGASVRDQMTQIAKDAFKDVVSDAMVGFKENK